MALLTIKVPQNAKSRITEFVKELGGEVILPRFHAIGERRLGKKH
ncbi:hypothetical protein [Parapedobacter tibetensis]|nr:hypothetical protein [Parapedobacter tibetensis]